jgi:anaerobic magnesium-protoporphyrin IX monomethyl ester cyclase
MPEIALINPPSPFLIDDHVFPNLGLMALSAYLKKYGYNPKTIDLSGGAKLPNIDSDIIGFYSTTPQYPYVLDILEKIKRYNPDALYIIGGPHATCNPETTLNFDVSIVGEGEDAILRIAMNPKWPYPSRFSSHPIKMDELPLLDRDSVDIHSYKYKIDEEPATSTLTSRGCPFSCAFCCKIFGKNIRFRSAKNVALELEELQSKYGYNAVMIYDDEFFINRERDIEICRSFKERKMLWRCFTRSNLVDEKLIKIASESGLREILIGIESGSDRILKNINKGTTVEMNKRAIKIIRDQGVRIKLAMILCLPGENEKSLQETEAFLDSIEFDDIDFSILQVYPGTEIYKNPDNYDIIYGKPKWFKGKPNEYSKCSSVSTSSLSFKRIIEARDRFEKKYKKW